MNYSKSPASNVGGLAAAPAKTASPLAQEIEQLANVIQITSKLIGVVYDRTATVRTSAAPPPQKSSDEKDPNLAPAPALVCRLRQDLDVINGQIEHLLDTLQT